MDWHDAMPVVTAICGALVSMGIAYIAVGRDLSFIKGQMVSIMAAVRIMEKVKDDHAVIKESIKKLRKDINAAHQKIRGDYEDPIDEINGPTNDD